MYACMYIYIYTYVHSIHTYMYIHTYIHTGALCKDWKDGPGKTGLHKTVETLRPYTGPNRNGKLADKTRSAVFGALLTSIKKGMQLHNDAALLLYRDACTAALQSGLRMPEPPDTFVDVEIDRQEKTFWILSFKWARGPKTHRLTMKILVNAESFTLRGQFCVKADDAGLAHITVLIVLLPRDY